MICLVASISGRAHACLLCMVPYSLALFIICSLTVAGQDFDCDYAYRTINQFEHIGAANVSCYSNSALPCGVFYAPPGEGCNYKAAFIDMVDANTTKTLSYDFVVGGAFCTNFQIDVTYQVDDRIMQLPRASDAGYFFNKGFEGFSSGEPRKTLRIAISALNSSAKVDIEVNWYPNFRYESKFLKPFETIEFDLGVGFHIWSSFRFTSDNPVVISYTKAQKPLYYYIWRPIYAEPVVTFVPTGRFVEFRALTCSNNGDNYINPSSTLLDITRSTTNESITECQHDRILYTHDGYMQSFTTDCVVLVKPNAPGICVTVSVFDSKVNAMRVEEMGSPLSRFATQLLGTSGLPLRLNSVVDNTCTAYSNAGTEILNFAQYVAPPTADSQIYYGDSAFLTNTFDSIECEHPFHPILMGTTKENQGHSGRMSDSLWELYFETFECQLAPPTEAPTEVPTEPSRAIFSIGGMIWLIALCYGLVF